MVLHIQFSTMEHLNRMENIKLGAPGLFLWGFGWLLQLGPTTMSTITFIAGLISTALAITYYIIQIRKSLKK